jgi:ketosteroid isomerase-like protein
MSQENVEVIRATVEAWNARDMNALGALYDPDIVVRYADGWPEGSEPIMGREAVVRQWEQQREPFDSDTLELIDFIDAGDRVVMRQIWRAEGSGPDLRMEVSSVSTLRKGKTILMEFFWDHAEALEAVGLSEQKDRLSALATVPVDDKIRVLNAAVEAMNAREVANWAKHNGNPAQCVPASLCSTKGKPKR